MKVKQVEIDWNPDLSIYASKPYLQAVGDEYGWLGGFDDAGILRCILPYTIVRKAIIRMVRFRVETIPLTRRLNVEEEKSFLNSTMAFFRSIGAGMIIPATTNTIFRTYPDGADAAPYATYIIDLTQSEETLFSNLSASHRRKVRLAKKSGVRIRDGMEHLKTAFELVRDTFNRSAISFMSYDAFSRMTAGLGEYVKLFVAEYRETVQGCLVIPYSQHSAYFLYGGSILNPVTGANNLLHWEAIRQLKELGVRRYDFVGVRINPEKKSKQEGIKTFKHRFGGRLVNGYIWKYSLNPWQFAAYSIAVRLLRGGDIVDCERRS